MQSAAAAFSSVIPTVPTNIFLPVRPPPARFGRIIRPVLFPCLCILPHFCDQLVFLVSPAYNDIDFSEALYK